MIISFEMQSLKMYSKFLLSLVIKIKKISHTEKNVLMFQIGFKTKVYDFNIICDED